MSNRGVIKFAVVRLVLIVVVLTLVVFRFKIPLIKFVRDEWGAIMNVHAP